jgi:hypothetical protein
MPDIVCHVNIPWTSGIEGQHDIRWPENKISLWEEGLAALFGGFTVTEGVKGAWRTDAPGARNAIVWGCSQSL